MAKTKLSIVTRKRLNKRPSKSNKRRSKPKQQFTLNDVTTLPTRRHFYIHVWFLH
uniref:Uncharacterized protein n=1 Tax=Oryza brachyantha TaxID=4533 RepID=J3N9J8_ORYBR